MLSKNVHIKEWERKNWIMHIFLRIILIAGLLSLSGIQLSAGSEENNSQSTRAVSQEVLQGKIKEVEAEILDEEIKKKLINLYNLALSNEQKAQSFVSSLEIFTQARKNAPLEIKNLRSALQESEKVSSEEILKDLEKMTLEELTQRQEQEQEELSDAEAKLLDLNSRLITQSLRPNSARERLIALKERLYQIKIKPKLVDIEGESASITQAQSWVNETQTFALSSEINMLDQELLSYSERIQVLKAKKDLAESIVKNITTSVQLINDLLNKRRLSEVELVQQQIENTNEESKGKHPLVRKLAEQNVELANKLKTSTLDMEYLFTQKSNNRASAKRIRNELNNINHKLEIAGINHALGEALNKQRGKLPKISVMQSEISQLNQRIADSGLRQIQYEEEYDHLSDIDAYLREFMHDIPQNEADIIRIELKDLALSRQRLLNQLIELEASYSSQLGELDITLRELMDVVKTYEDFLNEHLLWIRSTKPVSMALFKTLPVELELLLSPDNWQNVVNILIEHFKSNFPATVLLFLLGVLMFRRKYFLHSVVTTNEKIKSIRTDHFGYTVKAFVFTSLASLPLSLILMITGWQLSMVSEPTEFSNTVSTVLRNIWLYVFYLMFFTDLSMSEGVLVKHFRWPVKIAAKLHRELKFLKIVFLPSLFITFFSVHLDGVGVGGAFTMIGLLFVISTMGLFLYRIFTPAGGVLSKYFIENPTHLMVRLRFLWGALFVILIFSIVLLILLGYLNTGSTLMRNLFNMLSLFYFLILIQGLLTRWLLLVSRRLEVQAIMARREEARAAKEAMGKTEVNDSAKSEHIIEIDEPEIDLVDLSMKSQKLLKMILFSSGAIGLWLIWAPILPAFSFLNDISLWSSTATVNGVSTLIPVTLGDFILATIVIIVTIIASKGLPALLEFVLLQNKDFTIGDRYTATTLFRYIIVAVGGLLFFNILGANWSQIQWLVAALSVGIGFGLQEIVANFISGLIILFERPIRVGDTVTVGDTTGIVTRIQIRATTITNWERQELLVPNKAFITQELLNWTLSDQITRISIPVGIAYGSDVSKAMELLMETAHEQDDVLESPEASVIFTSFDDNSLKLILRVYISSVENRVNIITNLHKTINQKFNEACISIAFPQRDVHLDIRQPIDIRLHRDVDNGK